MNEADTYPAPGQKPGPRFAWICNGLVVTTTWHFYIDPFEPNRQYICYTDIGLARSTDAGQNRATGPRFRSTVSNRQRQAAQAT